MYQEPISNIPKLNITHILKGVQQQRYHSLFDTLNCRIEQHDTHLKSRSVSTRSTYSSDQKKIFKTPSKNLSMKSSYLKQDQITRINSLSSSPRQQMEFIDNIKTQGRLLAQQLNNKFQIIVDKQQFKPDNLNIQQFVKQFDKSLEMIEALLNTYSLIKMKVQTIKNQQKTQWCIQQQTDQAYLLQTITNQLILNSPLTKSLCQILQSVINTSLFQNQSDEIIQQLSELSSLVPNKVKKSQTNMPKTSVSNYRLLLKKINNLNSFDDRVPFQVSDTLIKSLTSKFKLKKSK